MSSEVSRWLRLERQDTKANKNSQHPQPVIAWTHRFRRAVVAGLIALALGASIRAAEPIEVFRTGHELIVQFERFDLLRETHVGLNAELKLRGVGNDKDLWIDLSDAAVKGTLVIDLSKFGNCVGLSISVKDAAGNVLAEKTVAPIVDIPVQSAFPVSPNGPFAYIEPGTAMTAAPAGAGLASPKIPLPDARKLRSVQIGSTGRSLSVRRQLAWPL